MAEISQRLMFAASTQHEEAELDAYLDKRLHTSGTAKGGRPWRAAWITRLFALAPFALAVYADLLTRPSFGGGIFSKPPEVVGMPLGVVMQAGMLAWAAVGMVVVWRTHSKLAAALAIGACTLVSLAGIWFGPAVVLILQNLA